jgi:hypothetical protein
MRDQQQQLYGHANDAGGTPILFGSTGSPVNESRMKQELVAPDDGDTTFFYPGNDYEPNDLPNFSGISAAAPHAADLRSTDRKAMGADDH